MEKDKKKNFMEVLDISVDRIFPNPFQPRTEFNEENLSSLAESVRQYGVMQPIVVTKKENGDYELIAGERRLRASKIAGKETIPAIVKIGEYTDEEKFELAIIENLQREDLNPIDKARSFKRLVEEFNLTHSGIAKKMGKSREYISNSLRILLLSDEILDAIVSDKISEGHARPLLMLKDRPYEQNELFKRIINLKMTVRAAEKIARSIAKDKVRKIGTEEDVELENIEKGLSEKLGTRVSIDKKNGGEGGKLTIEYFSREDLEKIVSLMKGKKLSASPILDENLENGIDKFEENFSNKKVEKKEPAIFKEEIKNLENEVVVEKKENNLEIKNPESENNFGGFNISSFDKERNFKIVEEFNGKNKVEEKVEEKVEWKNDIVEEVQEEKKDFIDNFGTKGRLVYERGEKKLEKENIGSEKSFESENKGILKNLKKNIVEDENKFNKFNDSPVEVDNINEGISDTNSVFGEKESVQKNIDKIINENKNQFKEILGDIGEKKVEEIKKKNTVTAEESFSEKKETIIKKEDEGILENKSIFKNKDNTQNKIDQQSQPEKELKNDSLTKEENERIEGSDIYKQFLKSKEKLDKEKKKSFEMKKENNVKSEDFASQDNLHKREDKSEDANMKIFNDGNNFVPEETTEDFKKEQNADREKIKADVFPDEVKKEGLGEVEKEVDEDEVKKKSIFASFSDFIPKKKVSDEKVFNVNNVKEQYKKVDEEADKNSAFTI